MNDFSIIKYCTVLSDDSKYADVYSSKGKLMSCFHMSIEDGRAILCDTVTKSTTTIPTNYDVVLIHPFEYDKVTDTLSVFMMLEDNVGVTFTSTINDLMNTRSFHHMKPEHGCPPIKPSCCESSSKPLHERYVKLDELLYETKMRKRGDEDLREIIESTVKVDEKFGEKLHEIETNLSIEQDVNKSQGKRLDILTNTVDTVKSNVMSNISDIKVALNEEVDKRISAQHEIFKQYTDTQMQVNKTAEKVNHLRESNGKLHHEVDKNFSLLKELEAKVEDGFVKERIERSDKDDEIINSIHLKYQLKGNYVEYEDVNNKQVLKLPYNSRIMGESYDGSVSNLVGISDNSSLFGSKTFSTRLFGKDEKISYNDKELAFNSDVDDALNSINLKLSENKETIEEKISMLKHDLHGFYHWQEKINLQLADLGKLLRDIQTQIKNINTSQDETITDRNI